MCQKKYDCRQHDTRGTGTCPYKGIPVEGCFHQKNLIDVTEKVTSHSSEFIYCMSQTVGRDNVFVKSTKSTKSGS